MANTVKHYQGEEHFADGYVPQSMDAEHSPPHKSIIWIGMGLMLVSLAVWGTFIFGFATVVFADETTASRSNGFLTGDVANYTDHIGGWNFDGSVFMQAGLAIAPVMATAGVACTSIGRRGCKTYRKEFDTHH